MSGHLVDTSIFIGREQGRALGVAPAGDGRISVATLTELGVGTRRADGAVLELRSATLAAARRYLPLHYDEVVAEHAADLLDAARDRGRRAAIFDVIIAATALAHDLTVWTQDADFDVLAELAPTLRVHRS